ncbi:MAG: protoglobin domain-containing protein [Acidobacteriota bacterium]
MPEAEPFQIGKFVLTEEEVRRRRAFFEVDTEDERRLRAAERRLSGRLDEIIDRFYEFLLSQPHTRELLATPGLVQRLKGIQRRYFLELMSGCYDRAYFENRLRVGLAHCRFGLSPQWYIGTYRKFAQIVTRMLEESFGPEREEFLRTVRSLHKLISLDMSLAIDAYILLAQEELAQKARALEELNARLIEVDAAKRHLTGAIVHDLQNPLAGIIAFLQVLEGRPEGLTEVEQRSLKEALGRCNDLSDLIMDVLQMNRAEEGRLDLYLENVDLEEIARNSVEAFSLVAEQGDHRLNLRSQGGSLIVRADQGLLRRILYNLVRNALQHTPAGTRVEVGVRHGPPWILSVKDDGPGIPTAIQNHLFEPGALRSAGFQVQSGLGLGFCKMAADALGIRLKLRSKPGEGSCFCLEQLTDRSEAAGERKGASSARR